MLPLENRRANFGDGFNWRRAKTLGRCWQHYIWRPHPKEMTQGVIKSGWVCCVLDVSLEIMSDLSRIQYFVRSCIWIIIWIYILTFYLKLLVLFCMQYCIRHILLTYILTFYLAVSLKDILTYYSDIYSDNF